MSHRDDDQDSETRLRELRIWKLRLEVTWLATRILVLVLGAVAIRVSGLA